MKLIRHITILALVTSSFLSYAEKKSQQPVEQPIEAQQQLQPQQQWRTLDPENTLYIETETGRIIIELAASFSPRHVEHVKKLVRAGFYDGLDFYRVINNFVVQGGDMKGQSKLPLAKQTLKAEFERTIDSKAIFTLVQSPDLLAEQTGFIDGFAVGRSISENKEWLISCPGVINLARTSDINSASTDFAIMLGQAPRHLDRNMSIFGRIISGIEQLNFINRGDKAQGGIINNKSQRSIIKKMQIAADLPSKQQLHIQIENTNTTSFADKLKQRRNRTNDFYYHKGNGALDICYIQPETQITKKSG